MRGSFVRVFHTSGAYTWSITRSFYILGIHIHVTRRRALASISAQGMRRVLRFALRISGVMDTRDKSMVLLKLG